MARKNRTPEEKARREKIRELLQMANIGSMDDIQNLFKETITPSIFTVNDMFEEALQVTRITMTEAEKRQFYDQYIRSLRLNIDRGVIEHRFQAQVNQIKL